MIVVIVVLSATVTHKANEADQHRAVTALGLTLSGCKVIFVFTTAQCIDRYRTVQTIQESDSELW